jgi:3-dehydroquinate dehydratase/shikimate dehydrogenase
MSTKLTVPIAAKDLDEAERQVGCAIDAGAEMLELRTDYLENLSIEKVQNLIGLVKSTGHKQIPIIVTCRDQKQGGLRDYGERLRVEVLVCALRGGAEFIDFEYENFLKAENQKLIRDGLSENPQAGLILSAHNFETRFSDIRKLDREILERCPEAIAKLVYAANHINDCFEAFDLLHRSKGEKIVFCMGEAGLISRILAKKLNGFVTFASVDERRATAPGQLTIGQLRKLYRYESINPDTELFGVIAEPVGHSLSPAIHNACFGEKQMNKLYLPLLVRGGKRQFDAFLNNVISRDWLNFKGFSVTIPHKQNALEFVKAKGGYVEPLAERIGAVNTVVCSGSGGASPTLRTYNTDYSGALDAIASTLGVGREGLRGLSAAVMGAGGVARAIVAGLSDAGAEIRIYNRTVEKAERLAAEFNCDHAPLDNLKGMNAKLVVNCTSIGMHPNVEATPVPRECLKRDMAVFDTVYNPVDTLLLKHAKQAGAKTIDGVSMFVNQGMAQFKLFTDTAGNAELMRKTICDRFENRQ